jgi:hypothetical protein
MDVFDIQGHQVQLARDEETGETSFFVLPFAEDDMAESLAVLPVSGYDHHRLRDGNLVHLISMLDSGGQVVRTADFTDPLSPRWRGELVLSDEIDHVYGGGWGFYDYYWSPSAGQPLENRLLPVTARVVHQSESGRRYYDNTLRVIDMSDPDRPRLAAGAVSMNDYPFVNRVGHGNVLYSTHTEPAQDEEGNKKQYHVRYFLDCVDASNPDELVLLPKLNIPGELVDVDESGRLLYTVDYQFDEFGRRRNSLNVLRVEGDKAVLVDVLPVGEEIDRARYRDRTVWLTSHKQPWWGMGDDTIDSRQPYTRLARLDFAEDGTLQSDLASDVRGYHFNLLDVEDNLAYLSSSYPYGLLVLDVSDVANPAVLSASRSIGYISKLLRHEDFLYMPMGEYGVRRTALRGLAFPAAGRPSKRPCLPPGKRRGRGSQARLSCSRNACRFARDERQAVHSAARRQVMRIAWALVVSVLAAGCYGSHEGAKGTVGGNEARIVPAGRVPPRTVGQLPAHRSARSAASTKR